MTILMKWRKIDTMKKILFLYKTSSNSFFSLIRTNPKHAKYPVCYRLDQSNIVPNCFCTSQSHRTKIPGQGENDMWSLLPSHDLLIKQEYQHHQLLRFSYYHTWGIKWSHLVTMFWSSYLKNLWVIPSSYLTPDLPFVFTHCGLH